MNSEAVQRWLRITESSMNPGVLLDLPEEPWPQSPVAPISERARQAFRNIGILD